MPISSLGIPHVRLYHGGPRLKHESQNLLVSGQTFQPPPSPGQRRRDKGPEKGFLDRKAEAQRETAND